MATMDGDDDSYLGPDNHSESAKVNDTEDADGVDSNSNLMENGINSEEAAKISEADELCSELRALALTGQPLVSFIQALNTSAVDDGDVPIELSNEIQAPALREQPTVSFIELLSKSEADDGLQDVPTEFCNDLQGPPLSEQPNQYSVSFIRLFCFADKYDYALMFFGTIGAAAHGAALPGLFLLFGKLLNGLGGSTIESRGTVNKYVLDFVWLGLVTLASSWLEVSLWMLTGERQSARLRAKYLQALLRQDVAYFDTIAHSGDIVNSFASDSLMVQDAISEKIGNFVHYMATFIAGFIVGFTNQWRIAAATLAVVPLISLAGGFYVYTLTSITAKAASAYAEAGSIAEQAIAQVRTVYSFVGEEKFVEAYSDALQNTMQLAASGGLAKGLGMGITYGTLFSCWSILLWYGGVLIRKGEANGGEALSTIFGVIVGSMALGQAMPNLTAFAKGRAAAFKIFQVIDLESAVTKPDERAETLEFVQGLIELRSVDFSYPSRPDVSIFKNFSLVIPAGNTLAIVGNSGSGKSTVVSLIERFYDPTTGEVLLDGHNLKKLNLKWLREQIGLVNQEPALFATTIAANILYGKDYATQEEIEEAAKSANAHCFIDQLPLGYQTQVGERGVQLSGGQKQRVAIARAMLKNPRVLLLDEATSALDAGSEQVVQEALDRLMVGRTTVVVAHRLSTIRNADSIAVVRHGRIVERGTHQDLISRKDGTYSALVRLQELAATKDGSMRGSTSWMSISGRLSRDAGSNRANSISSMRHGSSMRSVDSAGKAEEIGQPRTEKVSLKAQKRSVARLMAMTNRDCIYGVGGTIGSIGAGCLNPAFALIIGEVLTAYYSNNNKHMKKKVIELCLIFVSVGFAAPFIYTLQHYCMVMMGEKLVKRVRENMFATILRNDLGWFDEDENNSNRIAARLASDATNVRAAVGDRIAVIVQNFTLLLVSCIASLLLEWRMAVVMIATLPLLACATVVETWFLTGFTGDQAKAYSRATQVAGEAVANIRTVAAFNAQDKVQALFTSELQSPAQQSFLRGQVAGFGFGLSQCILYCAYAMGLWYAGNLIASGVAEFGAVIKVFLVLVVCAFAGAETLALTPDLVKGGQAVESVFEVLDHVTKIDPEDHWGEEVEKIKGDIELKHVAFAYPSRPDVIIFKNLNLKVRSGHSLALVGASGSGKSSIIALIERFYDPISGQILIDGKDLKKYNLKSVRQHIALVQQEPTLFSTTIYENILYGKDGASEAEVILAAKAANAHNFICSLPDGYETQVGERGVQLSGGQKQRVAISRAVLKDPAILLLDEATSALDAESETIVQKALDRLMKRRTTVMIAHRLSTIRGADSIAVVQDGAILEKGSHTELLAQGGGYSRLINLHNRVHESYSAKISRD